jgi:MFS family permease
MVSPTDASAREHQHRLPSPQLHLPHGLVAFPRQLLPWIEPWFLAYACLGVVQGGMLPLLLPLSSGGSTHAGTIVGVMNLAGLTSPFWGHLADRQRIHREVLLAGILAALVPLILMPAQFSLQIKAALAATLGLGFAAANTVANMFIVEVWPREQWDARIGALRATSGAGQVIGLLLAGFIGGRYALAFGVSAALVASALPIAWLTLRRVHVPVPRGTVTAHPPLGGEGWAGAPQRHCHLPTWSGLRTLLRELEMPFARLQIVWFVAFVAISAVLTMFPLAFIRTFGASNQLPAAAYAFAAAVSLAIYPVASTAKHHGARLVLQAGFGVRIVAMPSWRSPSCRA